MTIKIYGTNEFDTLKQAAGESPRKRSNLNIHEALDAPVQRLYIATEPDTYIRPHRHPQPNKWELFVVLEGQIELLIFNNDGDIESRTMLGADGARAVEIPPGTWHSYICHRPGTLALEIKEGPYVPTPEEDFAPWSPAEGAPGCSDFLAGLRAL